MSRTPITNPPIFYKNYDNDTILYHSIQVYIPKKIPTPVEMESEFAISGVLAPSRESFRE
jgi:hypothetical protein